MNIDLARMRAPLPLALILVVLASLAGAGPPVAVDEETSRALRQLKEGNLADRVEALRQISNLGRRTGMAVPGLIAALDDPAPRIRAGAANVLGRLGDEAAAAGDTLAAHLKDPDDTVRSAAARALDLVPATPERLLPAILDAYRPCPRGNGPGPAGAEAIRRLGRAKGTVVGPLIEGFRRPAPGLRGLLAEAVAGIGEPAVGPLAAALRDRDPGVREGAAMALGKLGQRAIRAVPALIAAIEAEAVSQSPNSGEVSAGEAYYTAIGRMGPRAVRALAARLDQADLTGRSRILWAIGSLKSDGGAAVPAVVHLLTSPTSRGDAAETLGRIGQPARLCAPMLIPPMKSPEPRLRARAVIAYARLAEHLGRPEEAFMRIRDMALCDPALEVRFACLEAIGMTWPARWASLEALLHDPDAAVRAALLERCRGWIRRPGSFTRGILDCLSDRDEKVREAAVHALGYEDLAQASIVTRLVTMARVPGVASGTKALQTLALCLPRTYDNPEYPFFPLQQTREIHRIPTEAVRGELAFWRGELEKTLRDGLDGPARPETGPAARLLALLPDERQENAGRLIARLAQPGPTILVVAALGEITPRPRAAILPLLRLIKEPPKDGPGIIVQASDSIEAIDPRQADRVLDHLLPLLEHPDDDIREEAGFAVSSRLPASMERVLVAVCAPSITRTRLRAICSSIPLGLRMASDGLPPVANPQLLSGSFEAFRGLALDFEEDDWMREQAIEEANALGLEDSVARLLLDAYGRGGLPLSRPELLGDLQSREGLRRLLDAFGDPDPEVRTVAVYGLAMNANLIEPDGPAAPLRGPILDALLRMLDDADTQVRWAAAVTIGNIGKQSSLGRPDLAQRLCAMLSDATSTMRPGGWAAVLWDDSRPGPEVVVASGRKLRFAAASALEALTNEATAPVPVLIEALGDEDLEVRMQAARMLGAMGPRASAAIGPLLVLLKARRDGLPRLASSTRLSPDEGAVAAEAAKAIGALGQAARRAVPDLVRALEDPDPRVRVAAVHGLARLGKGGEEAMDALIRLMHDPDADLRLSSDAAQALGRIGAAALPCLVSELGNENYEARIMAAEALGRMGAVARPGLDALRRCAGDADPILRREANRAVEAIKEGGSREIDAEDNAGVESGP